MSRDKNKKDDVLTVSVMETWLWDAACAIRGPQDAPKFKDFILPLIFYKRLSDVFDDEIRGLIKEYGSEDLAYQIIEQDHRDALRKGRKPMVRFYIPASYNWGKVRHCKTKIGEFITEAMREAARLNPDLDGVVNIKDFAERQSGQRTIADDRLESLLEVVSRHRLGLENAEPDILGRAYEYLLRKFAEGQGQSAGEFFTPKEVGWLMARLLDPKPRSTVYDPTCGSAGLLIKARLHYEQTHPKERNLAPKLFGQEMNATTYAIAKMNMFLHDFMDSSFAIGDTMLNPGFSSQGAGLTKFDYVVANPMWNQDNYDDKFYSKDQNTWKRFEKWPPASSADWAWAQHIWASLKDQGRAAIVLDTGAVSRGSGSKNTNKEKECRKLFVDEDRIEGVVLMPDNLFYNTTAPGIILLLNPKKEKARKGQIILINASTYFDKEKPKNVLRMNGAIQDVVNAFQKWKEVPKLSKIISTEEAQKVDYNLSPSQFVETGEAATHRALSDIMADLAEAKTAREQADRDLDALLKKLKVA